MKKTMFAVVLIIALVCSLGLAGCTGKAMTEKEYKKIVDESGMFDNTFDASLPQTKVAEVVNAHFADKTTTKAKKALVFGFDGARADVLLNLKDSMYSGINSLKKDGGLYLAYAGGETSDKNTLQHPSTAPGWSTILSGVWSDKHGVKDNGDIKSTDYLTFLTTLASPTCKTIGNFMWEEHINTYSAEKEFAKSNPNVTFNHFNDKDSELKEDAMMQQTMIKCLTTDNYDITFGIYEATDHAGHATGFSNDNYQYIKAINDSDKYLYSLIENIKARATYDNEDWLIIATTDHGGLGTSHGMQKIDAREIFIASNKKIL